MESCGVTQPVPEAQGHPGKAKQVSIGTAASVMFVPQHLDLKDRCKCSYDVLVGCGASAFKCWIMEFQPVEI